MCMMCKNTILWTKKEFLQHQPYCTRLASVTLGGDYSVEAFKLVFPMDSLTNVTRGSNVSFIGNSALEGYINLETVTIPENSILSSIGSSAFSGCGNLTSITIPESVTSIEEGALHQIDSSHYPRICQFYW